MQDERPATAGPLETLLPHQLAEGATDRDEAAAIALREVALGRQAVPWTPLGGIQGGSQVEVDLVVQRDGAKLESESGHRVGGPLGDDPAKTSGLVVAMIADNVISNRVKPRS